MCLTWIWRNMITLRKKWICSLVCLNAHEQLLELKRFAWTFLSYRIQNSLSLFNNRFKTLCSNLLFDQSVYMKKCPNECLLNRWIVLTICEEFQSLPQFLSSPSLRTKYLWWSCCCSSLFWFSCWHIIIIQPLHHKVSQWFRTTWFTFHLLEDCMGTWTLHQNPYNPYFQNLPRHLHHPFQN